MTELPIQQNADGTNNGETNEDEPEEESLFEHPDVRDLTLIDLFNKIQVLQDDFSVAVEAIKALGNQLMQGDKTRMAELNDVTAQMANLNAAFIKYQSNSRPTAAPSPAPPAAAPTAAQPPQTKPSRGHVFQHLRDLGVPQAGLEVDIINGKMVVRLPYLNDTKLFAQAAGYLQKEIGMQYIKERKNNRFEE